MRPRLMSVCWFSSSSLTKAESNYLVIDLKAVAMTPALNKSDFFMYNTENSNEREKKPLLGLFSTLVCVSISCLQ